MKLNLPSINSIWNDKFGDYIITRADFRIEAIPAKLNKQPRVGGFAYATKFFLEYAFDCKDKRISK